MKEPLWIGEADALAIHGRLLALHGGASGLRDHALLESALARPRQHKAYADAADIIDMATAYIWASCATTHSSMETSGPALLSERSFSN